LKIGSKESAQECRHDDNDCPVAGATDGAAS